MKRSELGAIVSSLLLAACDVSGPLPPPRPAAVAPGFSFSAVDTAIEITGEDFNVRAEQRADAGGSTVDASYRAWLGSLELRDVTWVDAARLRARVPAGLPAAWYDLALEGPYGTGVLARAHLVVDGSPPALGISVTAPPEVTVGDQVQLTLRAENAGTWIVEGVAPQVSASGAGAFDPLPAATAAQDVLPGATRDFVVPLRAVRPGAVSLAASIAGTDPRTGATVSATTSKSVVVRPPPSVGVIGADPFRDGSSFAFVAAYGGKLMLGPNRTGTGLVAMDPDGGAPASLALSIARDTSGNQTTNSAWMPPLPGTYPSIGFTGCTANSSVARCGPDNENGRGFMTSATFGGREWLVLGGARSGGNLEYVYLSQGSTSPLPFSFVDLAASLGANTRGFSAVTAAGGRLFLGFPDNGGNRPYGLALVTPPAAPGLNAVAGTDVVDLNLHDVYATLYDSFSSITMVDAIAELGGRPYFFNDMGCVVASSFAPATKAEWSACSPADGPAYARADSVEPTRQYDLTPADRAWPAVVPWKGRLFAIRNTTTGPQLWRCDPGAGTDPTRCDRDDWTLVAADASTGYRTRFGWPGATGASLLLATATHLWIGLDDPVAGIHLFRTAAEVPALASDFVGQAGCVTGTPCAGFGGDGFGAPATLTRILDGKVIEWSGGTDLVLATGDGTRPVKIVRVAP